MGERGSGDEPTGGAVAHVSGDEPEQGSGEDGGGTELSRHADEAKSPSQARETRFRQLESRVADLEDELKAEQTLRDQAFKDTDKRLAEHTHHNLMPEESPEETPQAPEAPPEVEAPAPSPDAEKRVRSRPTYQSRLHRFRRNH